MSNPTAQRVYGESDPLPPNMSQLDKEDQALLERIKKCLHRWASRYAESAHAKAHVKETKLLEQEIDEWLLRQ